MAILTGAVGFLSGTVHNQQKTIDTLVDAVLILQQREIERDQEKKAQTLQTRRIDCTAKTF